MMRTPIETQYKVNQFFRQSPGLSLIYYMWKKINQKNISWNFKKKILAKTTLTTKKITQTKLLVA